MFASLEEFEAPQITRALGSGAPLLAPAACMPVLQQLDFLFVGAPAQIPALTIAGGVLPDGTSVSGAGRDRSAALTRLAGETAEQLGLRGALPQAPTSARMVFQDHPAAKSAGRIAASDWMVLAPLAVPSDLLPSGPDQTSGFSAGLAAHPNRTSAQSHGALELLERDAVALWWAGANKAVSLGGAQAYATARLGPRQGRSTMLLDVTFDTQVPVVVAVSFDAEGTSFCFGAAARPRVDQAANAALRELGAAEFGLTLERDRGSTDDQGDTRWADVVDRQTFEARLISHRADLEEQSALYPEPSPDQWAGLLAKHDVCFVELDRIGDYFYVLKAISPTLQSGRETSLTTRLVDATQGQDRPFAGPLY